MAVKATTRDFNELVLAKEEQGKFLCIGLSPNAACLPRAARGLLPSGRIYQFCEKIIDATESHVAAYMLNLAHFLAEGSRGYAALEQVVAFARDCAPHVPIILDANIADTGDNNEAYARAYFDKLGVDAVTLVAYTGTAAFRPFLSRKGKGCIVLCKSSHPGAAQIQDHEQAGFVLWKKVAHEMGRCGNNRKHGIVMGSAHDELMNHARLFAGEEILCLVPDMDNAPEDQRTRVVSRAMNKEGGAALFTVSEEITGASKAPDFAQVAEQEAREFSELIKACRVPQLA
jgi:orotidine-5'-phosphate decarboxylase